MWIACRIVNISSLIIHYAHIRQKHKKSLDIVQYVKSRLWKDISKKERNLFSVCKKKMCYIIANIPSFASEHNYRCLQARYKKDEDERAREILEWTLVHQQEEDEKKRRHESEQKKAQQEHQLKLKTECARIELEMEKEKNAHEREKETNALKKQELEIEREKEKRRLKELEVQQEQRQQAMEMIKLLPEDQRLPLIQRLLPLSPSACETVTVNS